MKIKLDPWGITPTRAHKTDAGLDLKSPFEFVLWSHSSKVIDTGVHVELPFGTVGMIKSKSGLNVNNGIITEGVIDEGYTGSIKVKLYNHSDETVQFSKGDKIAQLVVIECLYPDVEIVDEISGGERGDNGFGSTGR